MITAKLLKEARQRADLTQAELAHKLGVSLRTITNWEADGSAVPEKAEAKVNEVLGGTIARVQAIPEIAPGFERGVRLPEELEARYEAVQSDVNAYLSQRFAQEEVDPDRERARAERGIGGHGRKERLLGEFSDIDLLHEMTRRARARGVMPTDWSARAFERDYARLRSLRVIAEDLSNIAATDVGTPSEDDEHTRDLRDDYDLASSTDDSAVDPDRG